MIQMHELAAKPSNLNIMQEIEKRIWAAHNLGWTSVSIDCIIPDHIVKILKSDGYKKVEFGTGGNLLIEW